MNTYLIYELQNAASTRRPIKIEAKSLNAAKIAASRRQLFRGTVLRIDAPNGAALSIKEGGKWRDYQ